MALPRDAARGVTLLVKNIQSYLFKSQHDLPGIPFRRTFLGFCASRPVGHPSTTPASPADPETRQECEETQNHHKQQQQSQQGAWQLEEQPNWASAAATKAASTRRVSSRNMLLMPGASSHCGDVPPPKPRAVLEPPPHWASAAANAASAACVSGSLMPAGQAAVHCSRVVPLPQGDGRYLSLQSANGLRGFTAGAGKPAPRPTLYVGRGLLPGSSSHCGVVPLPQGGGRTVSTHCAGGLRGSSTAAVVKKATLDEEVSEARGYPGGPRGPGKTACWRGLGKTGPCACTAHVHAGPCGANSLEGAHLYVRHLCVCMGPEHISGMAGSRTVTVVATDYGLCTQSCGKSAFAFTTCSSMHAGAVQFLPHITPGGTVRAL